MGMGRRRRKKKGGRVGREGNGSELELVLCVILLLSFFPRNIYLEGRYTHGGG